MYGAKVKIKERHFLILYKCGLLIILVGNYVHVADKQKIWLWPKCKNILAIWISNPHCKGSLQKVQTSHPAWYIPMYKFFLCLYMIPLQCISGSWNPNLWNVKIIIEFMVFKNSCAVISHSRTMAHNTQQSTN